MNPPDSHTVMVEQPAAEPKEQTHDDVEVSSEEESADLLLIAERSKRPNRSKPTGRHNVLTHFLKDPNCEVCMLTKTTRAPCRHRLEARGDRTHLPHDFGDATTVNHKGFNEENESRVQDCHAVVYEE